jgi:hypothetical protein
VGGGEAVEAAETHHPPRSTSINRQVISEPRVIAHLVHGTWPAGGFLAHRYPRIFKPQPVWIDEGSDFRRDVEARVPGIEWRPFRWSGENSELDRRRAAMSFADMLRRELDSAQDACHVAFAFLMFLLALSLAVFPFAVAMAIFAYSQPFLGLAFGADTFHLAIATEIAAEASPPRPAPVLEHVDPGDAGTRHSLHAMPAARLRLAAWIRERRDAFVQAPV